MASGINEGLDVITDLALVMAVPAIEYFAAAGRSDFASSPIVRTSAERPSSESLRLCHSRSQLREFYSIC